MTGKHRLLLLISFATALSSGFSSLGLSATALVYDGAGACEEKCAASAALAAREAGLKVRFINRKTWSESAFRDAVVWIQPGGVSDVAARALGEEKMSRIRKFVGDGGGYVGFCAGAFMSADTIVGNGPDAVRMLGIVPLETDFYDLDSSAQIIPIHWFGGTHEFYWEGGPIFVQPRTPDKLRGIEIVGYYPNGEIAALRTRFGFGRVFVTGFHPEAPQSWRDYYKLHDADGLDYDQATEMIRWSIEGHRR